MTSFSTVRTQLLFRSTAYLLWKSIDGQMFPGLFNGYAITRFDNAATLTQAVLKFKYSELVANHVWKVGTAQITKPRLDRMFGDRAAKLVNVEDIWNRYMIPFDDRLSKYQSDTKASAAGHCSFLAGAIEHFGKTRELAFLMIPLIIGYSGTTVSLEAELSEMIKLAGGKVFNDKKLQQEKSRGELQYSIIGLKERKADKLLELTPALKQIGFEVHPEFYGQVQTT